MKLVSIRRLFSVSDKSDSGERSPSLSPSLRWPINDHFTPFRSPTRSSSFDRPDFRDPSTRMLPIRVCDRIIEFLLPSIHFGGIRDHNLPPEAARNEHLRFLSLHPSNIGTKRHPVFGVGKQFRQNINIRLYRYLDVHDLNWRKLLATLLTRPENAAYIWTLRIGNKDGSMRDPDLNGIVPHLHVIIPLLAHLMRTAPKFQQKGTSPVLSLDLIIFSMDLCVADPSWNLGFYQFPLVKRLTICQVTFPSFAVLTKLLTALRSHSHAQGAPIELVLDAIKIDSNSGDTTKPSNPEPIPQRSRSQRFPVSSLTITRTEPHIAAQILAWLPITPYLEHITFRAHESVGEPGNRKGLSTDETRVLAEVLEKCGPSLRELSLYILVPPNDACHWLKNISLSSNTNLCKITLRSLTSQSLPNAQNFLSTITSPKLTYFDVFFSLPTPFCCLQSSRRHTHTHKDDSGVRKDKDHPHRQKFYWKGLDHFLTSPSSLSTTSDPEKIPWQENLEYLYVDVREHDEFQRDLTFLEKILPGTTKKRGFYFAVPNPTERPKLPTYEWYKDEENVWNIRREGEEDRLKPEDKVESEEPHDQESDPQVPSNDPELPESSNEPQLTGSLSS